MKQLIRIFFISALVTMLVCLLLAGGGVLAYNTIIYQGDEQTQATEQTHTGTQQKDEIASDESYITNELDKRINKTVAILGTDITGKLTDTIMVANVNNVTNEVHIISVPRDTQVKWADEQRALLPEANSWVTVSKLNEMSAWGGIENARGLTVNQLERLLGMTIDNYVIVSLSIFRDIVDAVGGVELDVPQRMYKEEVSGGLKIDLQPGVQVLDGHKAEQFVRFRDYPTGDLGRIHAQQQFVDAFMRKVVSPEILFKLPVIVTTLFESVKTDISPGELTEYIPYITDLSECDISFHMLPGSDRRENGISYYFVDMDATDELVETLFFNQ